MKYVWLAVLLQCLGGKMQKVPDMENGPFGLNGEQYWNQPLLQDPASDFGYDLVSKEIDGIFIDAPSRIFLDKHTSVPVACLRSGSMEKLHQHNFTTTSQLVIAHMETGRIRVTKPAARVRDPDQEPPSEGWTSVGTVIDLAEVVDLGPRLGRYAALILCGPESSNQRILSLYPSEKSEGSNELKQQLQELRSKGGSPIPLVVGNTLDLKQEPNPVDAGSIWKLALAKGQDGPRIRLDYRLEVPPRLLQPADKPLADESGKRIHAILPVTLVGFSEERGLVLHKDLGLPVFAPASGGVESPMIQGSVSLALARLLGGQAPRKTLYLWALSMDRHVQLEIPMGGTP